MEDAGAPGGAEAQTGTALVAPEFQGLGHLPFFDNVECRVEPRTGRMTLPAHLRPAFGDGTAVLRCMKEGFVNIWVPHVYVRWEKKLRQQRPKGLVGPRSKSRVMASAKQLTIDRQGRFVLPAVARDHLGLDGDVVVAGCGDHLELWHPTPWADEQAQFDEWDLDAADFDGLDLETGE